MLRGPVGEGSGRQGEEIENEGEEIRLESCTYGGANWSKGFDRGQKIKSRRIDKKVGDHSTPDHRGQATWPFTGDLVGQPGH